MWAQCFPVGCSLCRSPVQLAEVSWQALQGGVRRPYRALGLGKPWRPGGDEEAMHNEDDSLLRTAARVLEARCLLRELFFPYCDVQLNSGYGYARTARHVEEFPIEGQGHVAWITSSSPVADTVRDAARSPGRHRYQPRKCGTASSLWSGGDSGSDVASLLSESVYFAGESFVSANLVSFVEGATLVYVFAAGNPVPPLGGWRRNGLHLDNHLQLKDRLLLKSRRPRRNGLHPNSHLCLQATTSGATNPTWIPHRYKEPAPTDVRNRAKNRFEHHLDAIILPGFSVVGLDSASEFVISDSANQHPKSVVDVTSLSLVALGV
ncbi:hypothetical protein HPB47_023005 [Ixodes persulcatus]|uniref:Uncharacterized protein n=1 Tax=Ixodes persulcatus TaxID=34615 RepID=A0AC60Q868_IXOPE|nr:hypothetical protein HPB47_023005 [Ixodes persulcatus]